MKYLNQLNLFSKVSDNRTRNSSNSSTIEMETLLLFQCQRYSNQLLVTVFFRLDSVHIKKIYIHYIFYNDR